MNKSVVAAVVSVFAFSTSADGAAKYRKREVQITAAKRKQTASQAQEAAQAKGPALRADEFAIHGKLAKLSDKEITLLKRLIKTASKKDKDLPDYYFRLAEAYGEKSRFYRFRARGLDEQVFKARGSERAALKRRQQNYDRDGRKWLTEAVKTYLYIARSSEQPFLKYQKMDHVLFQLARLLGMAKKTNEARIFFRRLIKDYPRSRFIPDAWLSFAEFYFEEANITEALKLYGKVTEYPQSKVYGYAIYKQAWCYYNLKEPKKALERFVQAIKVGLKRKELKTSKGLVRQSRRELVRAWAQVEGPEKAWPFFQKVGGDYAPRMLELLARVYIANGDHVGGIKVYRQMIGRNPESDQICDWQNEIVKASLAAYAKHEQVKEIQRLGNVYQTLQANKNAKKSALDECREATAGTMRELATIWHKEAQKTQNRDTYALAGHLYSDYLDRFPQNKDNYKMRFYYAELLYKLGEVFGKRDYWVNSAEQYTLVVKQDPKGKHLKEAAWASVHAWKNALNISEEDTGKRDNVDPSKTIALSEEQEKMLAAFDTYLQYVPKAPERVQIIYNKGRIFYEHNRFDDAAPLFDEIATRYSKHELAPFSANLYLDCLNILKKFDELNRAVDKYLANKALTSDPAMYDQLNKLKQGSRWKMADQLREEKKFKQAGELYEDIAQTYPQWERYPQALFNAANMYEAAYLIGRAIALREGLIKWDSEQYAKTRKHDPQAQRALFLIGENYHALAWYDRAAEKYESFARQFPGEADAVKALASATQFRMGLGEDDKALADASLFVKNYGGRAKTAKDAAAVYFDMFQIYEKRKQWDRVVQHMESYLKKWGKKGGVDRRIRAHVKIGEILWQQSCPERGVNGACIKLERQKAQSVKQVIKMSKRLRRRLKGVNLKQCGPDTKSKITVFKRNPSKSKKAQQNFGKALRLFNQGTLSGIKGRNQADTDARQFAALNAAAQARFMQGEAQYEDFLRIAFPDKLDFNAGPKNQRKKVVEASKKRLAKWMSQKGNSLETARGAYVEVIKMRAAGWAIAAAARVGQLYQNFSDQLYTAPIPPPPPLPKAITSLPRDLRTDYEAEYIQTYKDAYCDKMVDEAEPLERKAVEGLDTCLAKSTELSWFNQWSGLCETELNQIDPNKYPIAAEIRAQPGYSAKLHGKATVVAEVQ